MAQGMTIGKPPRIPLGLRAWLADFCALHARVSRGEATEIDMERYAAGAVEVQELLLAVQRLEIRAGERLRRFIRIAQAVSVVVDMGDGEKNCLTQDISVGGFSALVSGQPQAGQRVTFSLRPWADQRPIVGKAKVVNVTVAQSTKAAFSIEEASQEDRERLEHFVFDLIIQALRSLLAEQGS